MHVFTYFQVVVRSRHGRFPNSLLVCVSRKSKDKLHVVVVYCSDFFATFLDTLISKKENAKFPGIYREGVKQNMHASPALSKEM